jgi:hypothetical protein
MKTLNAKVKSMPDKIKILFLAANPADTGRLNLSEEARDLAERVRAGTHREAFEIVHCLATRPRDLLRVLQEVQPHVIHFSGHGNDDRQIVLQDEAGNSRPVEPQDLADLVGLFKNNLKLVLMSCCYGRPQAEALNWVLDFTIGMDEPISDEGAVSFSAAFYQVLASGGSIKQAFESARLLTRMEGRPVFNVSDLLVREGADMDKPFVDVLPPPGSEESTRPARGNTSSTELNNTTAGVVNTVAGDGNRFDSKVNR